MEGAASTLVTSRATTVCSRVITCAAITMGSIVACGAELCPPRPNIVTFTTAEAAITGPDRCPMIPIGSGTTC